MNDETRARIAAEGVSVWLRAELPLLMKRVAKRPGRPLLQERDPETVMRELIEKRYPIYAPGGRHGRKPRRQHGQMVNDVVRALAQWDGWERWKND